MTEILQRVGLEKLSEQAALFLPKLVAALLLALVFWVIYLIVKRSLRALLGRFKMQEHVVRLLVDDVFRVTFLVFAAVMIAGQLGFNMGAALAGIGVAGLAVGFAAQDTLANVIAGFMIFLDQPFKIGDWIAVADQYGCVREVTLRTTRIRTPRNTYVVIPNKQVIDHVLENHSKHGVTRVDVPVGIAYKERIPDAKTAVLESVTKLPFVLDEPAPDVVVAALGASSVDLKVRVWLDDAGDEQRAFFGVMEASKLALDAAGIQIPYHHLQLFIDDVDERVVDKVAHSILQKG